MNEQLRSQAIELRVLMSVVFKIGHQAVERRIALLEPDMSRLQFGVLTMISHKGAQTISELSRKLGVDPSTLVPSVDALERKGLVVRQRDPRDRRRVPVSLTEQGASLVARFEVLPEDDPILIGLGRVGAESGGQLLHLLCALIHRLPDGPAMLEDIRPRMYAYGAKEEYLICKQRED